MYAYPVVQVAGLVLSMVLAQVLLLLSVESTAVASEAAATSAQVFMPKRYKRDDDDDAQAEVQEGLEDTPLSSVTSVVGGRALLGCDVSTDDASDMPNLVLFYKHPRGTPIYSIDARSGPFQTASHWSDLGARAYFNVNAFPKGLVIHGIKREDEGDYRCRVDFRLKPSRNARIRLNVVVPTKSVTISVGNDTVSGVIGPFPVGRALDLTCTATGGHPPPTITWWNEGLMVDSLSEMVTEEFTRNTLTLHHMRSTDLYRKFTCQAVNSNLTLPKSQTVTLDLIFPLESVSILPSPKAMSEDHNYTMVCEAQGSRPPSVITWWMDDVELADTQQEVLFEASITRSIVSIKPKRVNDGAILYCHAYNPMRNNTVLIANHSLTVNFPPSVQLQLRDGPQITTVKENDNIILDCLTEAKPEVHTIKWFIAGDQLLETSLSSGILINKTTLHMHKVKKEHSGSYTCQAINTQGVATSDSLNISVKYRPICGIHQASIYQGGQKEVFNITCNVEADPPPTLFQWAHNSSHGLNHIAATRFLNGHSHSTLSYKTHSPEDFGSLLCWAENEVGRQLNPCNFMVEAAVVPEAVQDCSISHSPTILGILVVDCRPGWGGGLEQTYSMEITSEQHVLANLSDQKQAQFTITGLEPGHQYNLTVISHNDKGSSVPKTIRLDIPLSLPQKHVRYEQEVTNDIVFASPILGILVGVAGALVICLTILVVIHVWNDMKHCKHHSNRSLYDKVDTYVKSYDEGSIISHEVCGSDIILLKADQHSLKENDHVYQYIRAQENVYVEPRTLGTKSIIGTLEKDNRMTIIVSKSPRSSIGGHQSPINSIGNPQLHNNSIRSYHSHRDSFSSRCSSPSVQRESSDTEYLGRYSPTSSVSSNPRISSLFSSRRGSCSTIVQPQDCYTPNTAGDSITTPLVTPTKAENIESSV